MSRAAIVSRLLALGACGDAIEWVETLPSDVTPEAAWAACERAAWLAWVATQLSVDRRRVVVAAAACARLALHVWEALHPDDARPRRAIEAAEAWARGEATADEVRAAARAAAAAARAAAYAALAARAVARTARTARTAWAAWAAEAAAAVAARAADAADAAADAAAYAAYAGVPQADLCAAVREAIPWPIVAQALEVTP